MLNLNCQNIKFKDKKCPQAIPTAGECLERIVREAVTVTGNTGNSGNNYNTGITGKPDPSKLENSPLVQTESNHGPLLPSENNIEIDHLEAGTWNPYQRMPTLQRILPPLSPQPVGDLSTDSQFSSSLTLHGGCPVYRGEQPNKTELTDRLLLHQNRCHLQMPTPSWAPALEERPSSWSVPAGERSSWLKRLWTACPLTATSEGYTGGANAQMLQECGENAGTIVRCPANRVCPALRYGRGNTDVKLCCQQASALISQEDSIRMDQQQLHRCQLEAAYNKPFHESAVCLFATTGQNTKDNLFIQQEENRVEVFTFQLGKISKKIWKKSGL